MCFEFSSCFGGGRDDYGGERSNRNRNEAGEWNNNRNGYYGGADHTKAQSTYQQPPAAVDEAGHKAYHDHAGAGARSGYTAYAQGQRKADIEAPKLPAWHNKVSDDAYTACLQEAATDHRNNAATDYHHYSTTALGRVLTC